MTALEDREDDHETVEAGGATVGLTMSAGDRTDAGRERTRAVAAMHRHGTEVREREVRRALRELPDDLEAETRAAVERLGRRLVGRVLASPTAGLLAAEDERAGTALELFESDREPPPGETGNRDPGEESANAGG